jgi:hypothetical protein
LLLLLLLLLHLPLPLPLPVLLPIETAPTRTVISTEAAHSRIVSSAAEKSASLPEPFPNPKPLLPLPFQV